MEDFGDAFEAGGEVYGVADDGEFFALGGADVADEDGAVVEADADFEWGAAVGLPILV